MRVATELLKGSPKKDKLRRHVVDEHFDLLHCDMDVVPKKDKEFKMLEKYVQLTHAQVCRLCPFKCDDYRCDTDGE